MKQLKPILHGRDHANGGPDPIPGLGAGGGALEWEDVGTAGPGTGLPYVAANGPFGITLTAAATSFFIPLSNVHASGITVGSDMLTITSAGNYEIMASGYAEISGAATNPSFTIRLEISGATINDHFTQAIFPGTVGAGLFWDVPITLLGQLALAVGATLRFELTSNKAGTAFYRSRVVVRKLG